MDDSKPICALVYEDGAQAQSILLTLIKNLRAVGVNLAGTLQHDRARPDRRHCDMELEDLASGHITRISEDRGQAASGCRLDRDAFARVEANILASLDMGCDLLIINKFGKTEVEGEGLRNAIATALLAGYPVLVGVPSRNLTDWHRFVAAEACEVHSLDQIEDWCRAHGLPLGLTLGS
jgi:nucleoside-triphosphatase THEP1